MSASIVQNLISKGQTPLSSCTSAKTGKKFDCILKVEFGDKYPSLSVEFDAPNPSQLGFCPKCGGAMERNRFGNISCSNWRSGYKYSISGVICGKKLTDSTVRILLTKGQTPELHGFKGKNGATFDAKLVLDPEGKVNFKFVDHPRKW